MADHHSFAPPRRISARAVGFAGVLGPAAGGVLATLLDLGLTDDEIGRYYRVPWRSIRKLRRRLSIRRRDVG